MKSLIAILILSFSLMLNAQTQTFYSVSQNIPDQENAGLLIRNSPRQIRSLQGNLEQYKHVKLVKLSGFNDMNTMLDSVIRILSPLQNLQCLVFEKSDLTTLETSLAVFKELREIRILKQSSFEESTFFPLLKTNSIENIYLQTEDPEFNTDSLCLLKHLKNLNLSNTDAFTTTNLTQKIQIGAPEDNNSIAIHYAGNLYQPVKGSKSEAASLQQQTGSASLPVNTQMYQTQLPCLKQPVPGIKINDTLYHINSAKPARVYYQSGSEISIDPNAFVDQTGKAYNGPVTVFYREFRNPVEIMLSGIPMTNTENGQTQIFRSGGMYEISAFDKNNQRLNTVSDTSVKINFAVTDTASDFKFYSLNPDGSWATKANSVTTKTDTIRMSKAAVEYFRYLGGLGSKADSTSFADRFHNPDYAYTFRRDNFSRTHFGHTDSICFYQEPEHRRKSKISMGLFRIKAYRQTKDKELTFRIVPAKKNLMVPSHISSVFNRTYLYTGPMTKEEFKRQYGRKLACWDIRTSANGNTIYFDIKTDKEHLDLAAQVGQLRDNKTFNTSKFGAKALNIRTGMAVRREARKFDRKERSSAERFNNINAFKMRHKEELAYQYCKQFLTEDEKKISYDKWPTYAAANRGPVNTNPVFNSAVGTALVKSGLGFNNIDCYLHKGLMQDVFVHYENMPFEGVSGDATIVLFKSINTSYSFRASPDDHAFRGYYYKNKPNYIIRFPDNNYMQVMKPDVVSAHKKGKDITLEYVNQFNITGLNSNEISRLILH